MKSLYKRIAPICARADFPISTSFFSKYIEPAEIIPYTDKMPDEQYILRMMIRTPNAEKFLIPDELKWIKPLVLSLTLFQKFNLLYSTNCYVYLTVRNGEVKSVTDDEWHVDGFSTRIRHLPEQNYIWSNDYPTEYLEQTFTFPADFDPLKHNVHTFLQDRADESRVKQMKANHIYMIDPYMVHRRPKVPIGTKRKFFRVSFVPIEIEDDTCTPNPLMPKKIYGRDDIRKSLVRYGNPKASR